MDGSVKQRLVGAAVLVVLAVVFLPMVFDGPEETQSEAIDLGIPAAPEREFETRVVPLDPAVPVPAPAADPDRIVTVDANAPGRTDALAGTPDAPAQRPAVSAPATKAPAASTATTAATTPATTPPTTPANADAPASGGRYVVSFGSYAKAENASALVASLKQAGIDARAEPVDVNGQPGMRVRSGPYIDRAQADKARLLAARARADAPGTIVEVDDATPAAAAAPAASGRPAGWAVQVGAYQDAGDAEAQRDKLRGAGFSAYVDTVRTEKGTLHRVRIGPELKRANADAVRAALKAKLGIDGMVVSHP